MAAEYARLAPDYDEKWSFYVEATTRETLARLSLRPADRLLDVGCGTGVLLDRLSRAHPATLLSGVDPVPEMLAVARRRLPPEIELREGWAERLPFEDGRFDVLVSCNMFHYIRHPAAALREMGRVLSPGGWLVITDWCDDYLRAGSAAGICGCSAGRASRCTVSGSAGACSGRRGTVTSTSNGTRSVGCGD